MKYIQLFLCLFFVTTHSFAQNTCKVIGYVYEENNRGYLNEVTVKITHPQQVESYDAITDQSGKFEVILPIVDGNYALKADKNAFKRKTTQFSTTGKNSDEAVFVRVEMTRQPGYLLDMTLSDLVEKQDQGASYGIENAHIEVYNNTTQKEVINIADHPHQNIKVLLEQGNEYIFMIRKEGYYTKRMRANVNVNGCILCMEGFGSINPGVSDNLTKENTMGTLMTNVSMKKMVLGENLKLDKIYYDLGKSTLRPETIEGLNNLVELLRDNPNIIVELSSHTDARGNNASNLALSQRRAQGVMDFIKGKMDISNRRITAKGYGETRLVNSCADGVTCSDEMHQQNRRTELTIMDILIDKSENQRTLASIMQEQNFDKILDANTDTYAEADTPVEYSNKKETPSLPKTIGMNYNGYKIELISEKGEITLDHPIFFEFDDVFIDVTPESKNSFMLGHFDSKDAAIANLKKYKKQFPAAKVIQYKESIRQ